MPYGRVSARVNSPTVAVFIDMGNPLLNRTVDGFLKIGAVGASHVVVEEAYSALEKGSLSKNTLVHAGKKMGKEGLKWGTVAGVYTGMEYGFERVRGKRDWKNALIGGALTGALLTFGESNFNRDKMIRNAITGTDQRNVLCNVQGRPLQAPGERASW